MNNTKQQCKANKRIIYRKGAIVLKDYIEIPLPNGYVLIVNTVEGNIFMELQNPNGYIVADKLLNGEQTSLLKEVIK
jgi:hypothetical protein